MATKEDQEALHLLVQYVTRAFYEPKFVIIMDMLIRHPVLKDDDLAGRIGLQAKELNKLMAILTNDRLVRVARQNELKDGAQRSMGKQYYYIDYQNFCNVVKWRVTEMRRTIDTTLRKELDNKGYICPNCKATFSPLEADRLMDFMRGTFVCDQCTTSPGGPHEVILNEDEETVRGSKDRMERFNRQLQLIREGLRKSEDMVLPAFNVDVWIKKNFSDADKQRQGPNGGLRIAGTGEKREEQVFEVQLEDDKDEATRRKEREAEAEAKRQQNVLPTWHLKSTISDDLTSLGVKAKTHDSNGAGGSNAALLESLSKRTAANSDSLAGLGKPRQTKVEQSEVTIVEEVKPTINHNADFYEQYYASLEAASRIHSTSQTPMLDNIGSDFDEEERKPNLQYLDSMSSTRKRSRSFEDEGDRIAKTVRSANGTPGVSRSSSALNSGMNSVVDTPSPTPDVAVVELASAALSATMVMSIDDPMVFVGGEPMPYSQVTQEIADERMSPEEYTAWYEIMMAQG